MLSRDERDRGRRPIGRASEREDRTLALRSAVSARSVIFTFLLMPRDGGHAFYRIARRRDAATLRRQQNDQAGMSRTLSLCLSLRRTWPPTPPPFAAPRRVVLHYGARRTTTPTTPRRCMRRLW